MRCQQRKTCTAILQLVMVLMELSNSTKWIFEAFFRRMKIQSKCRSPQPLFPSLQQIHFLPDTQLAISFLVVKLCAHLELPIHSSHHRLQLRNVLPKAGSVRFKKSEFFFLWNFRVQRREYTNTQLCSHSFLDPVLFTQGSGIFRNPSQIY